MSTTLDQITARLTALEHGVAELQRSRRRVVASVLVEAMRAGRAYREAERAYDEACEAVVRATCDTASDAARAARMLAASELHFARDRFDAALEACGE